VIPTHRERQAQKAWTATSADAGAGPPDSTNDRAAGPSHKLLVTPEEAATILSLGRSTVYELMATKELESVRIKSCRRIPVSVLERFVQSLLEGS
jgi:excisionase family DNA binding protein